MNFEFIRECRLESDELQAMYDNCLLYTSDAADEL